MEKRFTKLVEKVAEPVPAIVISLICILYELYVLIDFRITEPGGLILFSLAILGQLYVMGREIKYLIVEKIGEK